MKNAVDQKHGVIFTCRAFDVTARGRRQIIDAVDFRTIFRRQRRAGEDRQMMVSAHAPHLAERDTLT